MNTSQTKPQGYRSKPAWIYALSAFMCASPFVCFLLAIRRMGESHWATPSVWLRFAHHIPGSVWALVAFFMMTGAALVFVRRVTWTLALIAFALLVVFNVVLFKKLPLLAGLAMAALTLRPLRNPFLSPKLRWWEQAPRVAVDLEAVSQGERFRVINISATGALLESQSGVHYLEGVVLQVSLSGRLELDCKVVRRDGERIGVSFVDVSRKTRKAIRRLIASAPKPKADSGAGSQPPGQLAA